MTESPAAEAVAGRAGKTELWRPQTDGSGDRRRDRQPDRGSSRPQAAEPRAAAAKTERPNPAADRRQRHPGAPKARPLSALPLANYDTLTVASLRARLRTLTVPQLRILLDYEKAHQGREEVIGMFERRIAKIVAGETTSFPAVS